MTAPTTEMPPDGAPLAPTRTDPVARGASGLVGGPLGDHAAPGRHRFWSVARVLVALTLVTSAVGWVQKAPCRTHPWVEEYQYTRMCYSDVLALWYAENLDDGAVPYADHPVEYPPVIGLLMQTAAAPVQAFVDDDPATVGNERAAAFVDLTAVLLAASALVVTLTTARLAGRRRAWDAAAVALAPVLALHLLTNWDLPAVALTGLGLVAWQRHRPVRAGVWLGLAVATKLYPVLVVGGLLLLAFRARRLGTWARTAAAAAGTLAVVYSATWAYASSFVTGPEGPQEVPDGTPGSANAVLRFFELNRERGADWDTLWFLLQRVSGWAPSTTALNTGVAVASLLAVTAVAVLVLRAPRRPRVAQVVFLLLVAFLLTNKVFSPQYVLWLLPFAVLARPRWGPLLAWQVTEAFLLFTRFYFFVGNDVPGEGLGYAWFGSAVVLRDLALLALAALVVRDVLRPESDVVRADGTDDPAGGPLADAPPRARPAAPPAPATA